MKPAAFVHHRPETIAEATRLLADLADQNVRILAGGQSLVPMMAFRLARPDHLVDINAIRDLKTLAVEGSSLRIGALTRHRDLETGAGAGATGAVLARVYPNIAHFPIRTRGTFCGSVAHADPASEWCLVCVALDARIVLTSSTGTREIAAANFFEGAMSTAARADEMISEVRLPLLPADTRCGFQEVSRRKGDFALSMVLVTYRLEAGVLRDARVAVGGAEDHPRRFAAAEAMLEGENSSPALFAAVADTVARDLDPMEGPGTTAAYRRDLTRALVIRALEEAAA